jgi:hypothetical protein
LVLPGSRYVLRVYVYPDFGRFPLSTMTRIHHPQNKAERLLNAQKKARARQLKEEREGRVRARLTREALKLQETEDELHLASSDLPFVDPRQDL